MAHVAAVVPDAPMQQSVMNLVFGEGGAGQVTSPETSPDRRRVRALSADAARIKCLESARERSAEDLNNFIRQYRNDRIN